VEEAEAATTAATVVKKDKEATAVMRAAVKAVNAVRKGADMAEKNVATEEEAAAMEERREAMRAEAAADMVGMIEGTMIV
jgi:hypothetical protein